MIFDTTRDNIILISYPSGGFGNFLYHVLTEFAKETVKVDNSFKFNSDGNSHSTKKYTEIYYHDRPYNSITSVDVSNKTALVLCDNGISNDSYDKILQTFPNARIVRAVIDVATRPVIYKTCIEKAMKTDSITETIPHVIANWPEGKEDYAIRENFTLFYHNWPFNWDYSKLKNVVNLSIEKLIVDPVNTILNLTKQLGLSIINVNELIKFCDAWFLANKTYFNIHFRCNAIMLALIQGNNVDLTDITELHDQGYINYCVEKKFNIEIPVYDYRCWFKTTKDILDMVNKIK